MNKIKLSLISFTFITVSCVKDDVYIANNNTIVPDEYKGLILNELNGNDKFIELYNYSNNPISLKGVYIEKDGKYVWEGGDIILDNGEYLLLYSEDVILEQHPEYEGSGLVFTSGLSAKKELRVQLFTPYGISIDDFNLVDYTSPAPASYSRYPDGTGSWTYASATPGKPNAFSNKYVTGIEGYQDGYTDETDEDDIDNSDIAIALNEINGNDKYIEIYNRSDISIDLNNWTIEKDENLVWKGNAIIIQPKGYIVIYSDKADILPQDEDFIFTGGISSKKNVKVSLKNKEGELVDSFTRGSEDTGWGNLTLPENKNNSFSRVPDGVGEWYYAEPTPGVANSAKTGDIEQE